MISLSPIIIYIDFLVDFPIALNNEVFVKK